MKTLALFDFDGTLTNRDSFIVFLCRSFPLSKLLIGSLKLSPYSLAHMLRLMSNGDFKRKVYQYFFKGKSHKDLDILANSFSRDHMSSILRVDRMLRLNNHIRSGHRVVIVSASPSLWLKHWTERMGLDLISTELEVKDGMLTGDYLGKNCCGEEKVLRIKEKINLDEYREIYAYGNSKSDMPMLDLSDYPTLYKKYD